MASNDVPQELPPGSLDSDLSELEAELSRLQNESDALPLSARVSMVERMRSALDAEGIKLTDDDERVFSLYCEGVLDSRHVDEHFAPRLVPPDEPSS